MHSHYIHNHSIRHTLQILSRYCHKKYIHSTPHTGHCPGIDALSLYTQSLYQTYPTDIVSLLITRSTSTLLLTRALSRYWCTLITSTITLAIRHTLQILSLITSTITLSAIDHKKYIHSTPHMGIVPVLMHSHYIHNHSIRHTLQILSRYWSGIVPVLMHSHHIHSLYQTYPTDIVSLLITIGTSTLLLTRALSRYWCTLIIYTITLSDIPYRYCLAIDHNRYIHSTPHTGIVPVLMHSHHIHNHSIRHTLQILSRYWSQEVHPLYSSHGHCPGIDALSLYTQSLYQTYPTDIVSLLITIGTSTLLLTRALSRYWCTLITSTITLSDIPYRYCLYWSQ